MLAGRCHASQNTGKVQQKKETLGLGLELEVVNHGNGCNNLALGDTAQMSSYGFPSRAVSAIHSGTSLVPVKSTRSKYKEKRKFPHPTRAGTRMVAAAGA